MPLAGDAEGSLALARVPSNVAVRRAQRQLAPVLPRVLGASAAVSSAETFGQVIRAARERAGLSQAELAELCGVKQPAVAKWETSRSVTEDTVRRVAKALRLRVALRVA